MTEGFFTAGFKCFSNKQLTISFRPKKKKKKSKMKKDSYFVYIHLAKYSEFSLFPELGSIENLCENDFIIFF